MDDVFRLRRFFGARGKDRAASQTTARFGGDHDDEPVLVGTVSGPIEIEMAREALREQGIPALVKQSSVGAVYGLTMGALGSAEVWVLPVFAERARDTLTSMGLIEDAGDDADQST